MNVKRGIAVKVTPFIATSTSLITQNLPTPGRPPYLLCFNLAKSPMIMIPSTVNPLPPPPSDTDVYAYACACVCGGGGDDCEDYEDCEDGGCGLTVRSSDATIGADNTTRGMMISRRRRRRGGVVRAGAERAPAEQCAARKAGGELPDESRRGIEATGARESAGGGEAGEEAVGGFIDGGRHRVVEKSAMKASEVASVVAAGGGADEEEEHRASSKTKVAASSTVGQANKANDVNKEKRRITDKTKNAAKLAMKKVTSFGASSIFKCNKKKNPNENNDDVRCHH